MFEMPCCGLKNIISHISILFNVFTNTLIWIRQNFRQSVSYSHELITVLIYRSKSGRIVIYTYAEMVDMHLMYGCAIGSECEARRLYQVHFPQRRILDRFFPLYSFEKVVRLSCEHTIADDQEKYASSQRRNPRSCCISIDKHEGNNCGSCFSIHSVASAKYTTILSI